MWDEIILLGLGYAVFHSNDAECFEIDSGIEDYKNHLMTEKHRIMITYMTGIITYTFPVYQ